jgi:Ca2+-transporting ATPase
MSRSHTPAALPIFNAPNPAYKDSLRVPSPGPTPYTPRHTSSSITSAYSLLSPEETVRRLDSSATHGISPAEAEARLHQHGHNELPSEEAEPLWLRFLKQFKETLILLLLGSAAVSFFLGNLDDAVSITIAVAIVVTVGFVQEYRSEKSLEALNKLVPHFAHLIRGPTSTYNSSNQNGKEQVEMAPLMNGSAPAAAVASHTVPAVQLVPGDLVLFSTGDRIPADVELPRLPISR